MLVSIKIDLINIESRICIADAVSKCIRLTEVDIVILVITNYFMRPFYTNDFDLAPVGLYTTGAVFQGWSVVSNFVEVLDDFDQ